MMKRRTFLQQTGKLAATRSLAGYARVFAGQVRQPNIALILAVVIKQLQKENGFSVVITEAKD